LSGPASAGGPTAGTTAPRAGSAAHSPCSDPSIDTHSTAHNQT
jgi:hypothetical protein